MKNQPMIHPPVVCIDSLNYRPPQDEIPFQRQGRYTNQADVLPQLRVLQDD
jgi:hypothetical protein